MIFINSYNTFLSLCVFSSNICILIIRIVTPPSHNNFCKFRIIIHTINPGYRLPLSIHRPPSLLPHHFPICAPLSDCEIVASVLGMLPRGLTAPHITLRLELPLSTSTTTTRHTGHPHQTFTFTPASSAGHQDQRQADDKEMVPSLTWTLKNFPGDGEAKAFIRVRDLSGVGLQTTTGKGTIFSYYFTMFLAAEAFPFIDELLQFLE